MQNTFLGNLQQATNYTLTENGAVTHKSTGSKVYDMFSLGGAYRKRSDEDCIVLFKNAFEENEALALKCLFYLRDARGGQGERRFFRVCFKWLCQNYPAAAIRNIEHLSEYGRWDDMWFATEGTPVFEKALEVVKHQLALDVQCKTPSLLAKWMPSENTSSKATKAMAHTIRNYLGFTHKQYRKTLSILRERINIVERLMSANEWDKIEFDKIPSRAGLIYKNAFARRDIIAKKYETFAKDKTTKVNASVLYPHEVAHKAFETRAKYGDTDREMIQKYWDNLPNYYRDNVENGIAVVDTSGSMYGQPIEVAISMGAYIAEKAHGPFANHFITFSANPNLIEFKGVDITDKFNRCKQADWGMNTNIEAVFDLLLRTAEQESTRAEDMPERIYIFSDMEFDSCVCGGSINGGRWGYLECLNRSGIDTLMERMAKRWAAAGYKLPSVVFWNVDARQNNIPAIGDGFNYVSGFSPVMIETILSGRDGISLMLDKLNSERYAAIG